MLFQKQRLLSVILAANVVLGGCASSTTSKSFPDVISMYNPDMLYEAKRANFSNYELAQINKSFATINDTYQTLLSEKLLTEEEFDRLRNSYINLREIVIFHKGEYSEETWLALFYYDVSAALLEEQIKAYFKDQEGSDIVELAMKFLEVTQKVAGML